MKNSVLATSIALCCLLVAPAWAESAGGQTNASDMHSAPKAYDCIPIKDALKLQIPSGKKPSERESLQAYRRGDYAQCEKLIEEEIAQLQGKVAERPQDIINISGLIQTHLVLAYVYAWRLADTAKGLEHCARVAELTKCFEGTAKMFGSELLTMAEIYEKNGEPAKAMEKYDALLQAAQTASDPAFQTRARVRMDLGPVIEEFSRMFRFQKDSLRLREKTGTKAEGTPFLPRLRLPDMRLHDLKLFMYFIATLNPAREFEASRQEGDLATFVKQSDQRLSSALLCFLAVIDAEGATSTDSSQMAIQAFLAKYPESYPSLSVLHYLYKTYKQSGLDNKASVIRAEIERIAQKRGMTIVVDQDPRFSSPERTWETYKGALREGDLDRVLECYAPWRQDQPYLASAGKAKLRERAQRLGAIEKMRAVQDSAEYRSTRMDDGKEIKLQVVFSNLDGEWRMEFTMPMQ